MAFPSLAPHRHLSKAWVVVVSALGLSVGCYRDPDINKIVCGPPENECPSGYVCRISGAGGGRCCRPDDVPCGTTPVDSASAETSADAASSMPSEAGAGEGGVTVDGLAGLDHARVIDAALDGPSTGPWDTAPDAVSPDVPLLPPDGAVDLVDTRDATLVDTRDTASVDTGPVDTTSVLKTPGDNCTTAQECSGGRCADGHCCASASCPACQACTGPNGTCEAAPSSNGQQCGTNQYCNNGTCSNCTPDIPCSTGNSCENGAISCASGVPTCSKTSNKSSGETCDSVQTCTGGVMTPAGSCNGSGNCIAAPPQACGNGCSGNACALLKTLGAACGSGSECSGGNCVDGHCCGSASCPSCQACTGVAGTCAAASGSSGQPCGTNLYCNNGSCNSCTPGLSCSTGNACETGQTSCGTGVSTCVKSGNRSAGTPCGTVQTCTGSTKKQADACSSSGTCVTGSTSTCVLGCAGDDCVPLLPNGYTCSASSQCQSGYCVGTGPGTCDISCGALGGGCCVEGCSGSGLVCFGGMCVRCGIAGYRCCTSNVCTDGSTCSSDICG